MGKWSRYRELFGEVTPAKSALIAIVLLLFLETTIALVSPWLAGQFTESLLSGTSIAGVSYRQLLLFWLGLLGVKGVLNFFSSYWIGKISLGMLTRLRIKVYDHLQSLPLSYFHENKQGRVLAFLTNDATLISDFVTRSLVGLVPILMTICGALVCIFFIQPLIALLAALLIPLFYIVTKVLGRSIQPLSRAMVDDYSDMLAIAQENLATLPLIKAFGRESVESEIFKKKNHHFLDRTIEYLKIQSVLTPLTKFLATTVIFIILWVISEDLSSGRLGMGEMISLMLYGLLITQPISGLANLYGQTLRTLGAMDRLQRLFLITGERLTAGRTLRAVSGKIMFRNIRFHYPGRVDLLTGLTMTVGAGEKIAITGANGAGKTTLIHLLMRFLDPRAGTIAIDGHTIADLSLLSLRQQIGLVQQQVLLHHATVAGNIRFGRQEASMAELERAAEMAHAAGFIKDLPDGYNTVIGDQGVKLSGGQKQRLALARVLVKDPPILILDEATAMFDPKAEQAFIRDCQELLARKTVILISHRSGSLALADTIYRLEGGRVVKQ